MGTSEELTDMLMAVLAEHLEFDDAMDKMTNEEYDELCEEVDEMVCEWLAE
jgi:hypothetical protein